MDKDKNLQQNNQQAGSQNPTVNAPGSQVADYGDVKGGEGSSDERSQRTTDKADRSGVEPLQENDETLGTP